MLLSNAPGKLVLPFANGGGKNSIPTPSQIGITAGAASLVDGFPPLTRTPLAGGGVPPSGLDMNGILFEMSAVIRWANAGGGYPYDATFATDVNVAGYPKGARVMRSDGLGYWFNTVDDNVTDPESAGAVAAGWVPDFAYGAAAIAMSSANVTLTELEYGKPIIVISGLLTANLNLIFPDIVAQWLVINDCTGPFAITCKTSAGTGVTLAINSSDVIYGDATNLYSTTTRQKQLHNEIITTTGNFTTPANITADTVFKITLVGAGGGGGGQLGLTVAGGGGAGAVASFLISGLSPSAAYAVVVGAGGTGGVPTSVGAVGGTTQITIGGTVYSCAGGAGGSLQAGSGFTIAAAQGAVSASILALPSVLPVKQQRGLSGFYDAATSYVVSKGGFVPYGDGGDSFQSIAASGYGSGGCGGVGGINGNDGCPGLFIAEWVA